MTKLFRGGIRTRLFIALFACLLYLPGFWWGAPTATSPEFTHSWGTDDETPLGPLAEIHNIIQPKADRNLGYPLMYSFIVSAAYTPYLGSLWLTGELGNVSGHYPFGFKDPVTALRVLTMIAHFVTVLMGVGVIVLVFEAARVLWGQLAGVVAALLTATSYPMFYYSRTGNVDVPMLFFVSASMAVFARCLAKGFTVYRCVWLGVYAGFAMATKESALGAFILIPAALFWWQYDQGYKLCSGRFWKMPAAAITAALLALGMGSGFFVDPTRYIDHLMFIAGRLEGAANSSVSHIVMVAYPYTWAGNIDYLSAIAAYLVDMMTLPGLVLGISGLILALWRCPRCAVLPLAGLGYLVFIFLVARSVQMRYLLPVPMALSFAAAWLTHEIVQSGSLTGRSAIALIVGSIVSCGLVRGGALSYEMMFDSRLAAGNFLAENTSAGDKVEYFGPEEKLPPFKEGILVRRATDYYGMHAYHPNDSGKAREIVQGWGERKPKYVILVPDHTSRQGQPFNVSCPELLCNSMINDGAVFHQVVTFKTPPLFPWLRLPELDYPSVNPEIRIFSEPGRLSMLPTGLR